MSDIFKVEIITPDQIVFKSDVKEVIIPSYEGQMGILKDHIPLITFLKPGIIVIKNQEEKKYYIEEGTVEFSDNNLLILTSKVEDINNLAKSYISNLQEEAEKKLKDHNSSDKEKYIAFHKIETLKEINR
jgi:F-type H+-transporting ATPase subunit epsilon|tara:strand:- start:1678 stop:2067 length:390 start_codon:yes stop_codon:yes gene_type:complete